MSARPNNNVQDGLFSPEMRFSSKIHASYGLGSFLDDFLSTAFSMWVFYFYETEVLLPGLLVATAFVVYGLWNMFNDPLVGYISDIPTRFTKRWGKRYPWFIFTAIPCALMFTVIFTPPLASDWEIFFYLLGFICLFDFFFSFWSTNWMATFPVKFRSHRERTRVATFVTPLSQVGLALGMLIPTFLITEGNRASYGMQGLVVSVVAVCIVLMMLPSMHEDQATREHALKVLEQQTRSPYFQTLKQALKEKNFLAYLMAYLAQTVMMVVVLASVPYLVEYVLHDVAPGEQDLIETCVSAAVLLGGVIMVPVWIKVSRKYGNRIGYMCGMGFSPLMLIAFFFITEPLQAMIGGFFIGMAISASWTLLYPTFSDVIDEIVIKTGKRNEGIYYGFRTFFGRLSIVIQAVAFGAIHTLTGFVPDAPMQTDLALLGLRIQMGIIPMIFYLIGFLFMWRVYDLKPAKVQEIKKQLEATGL